MTSQQTLDTTRQLVVFTLGEEEYALPIRQVQEIIRYAEPRAIASADPWRRGVINLRGKIITVVDLALRLGLPVSTADDQKIIVVESSTDTAGLIVDSLEEVLTINEDSVDDVPHGDGEGVDAIIKIGDRLVVLLSPDALLERFAAPLALAA